MRKFSGLWKEALILIKSAKKIVPLNISILNSSNYINFRMRQYEEFTDNDKIIELHPEIKASYHYRFASFELMNNSVEVETSLKKYLEIIKNETYYFNQKNSCFSILHALNKD